ncbi:MAG: preprotein translocase subunit YajC [Gammaproteobacteria bacterium]
MMKIISLFASTIVLLTNNTAFAQVASSASDASAQQGSAMGPLLFLLVLVAFMYFLVWRPQQKRAKEHRQLVEDLKAGDEVMTNGGLLGTVKAVYDNYIEVALNENNTVIAQKNAIAATLPKGTIKSVVNDKG